jgi:hypothetical protein
MEFEIALDLVAENLTRHPQVRSPLFGKPKWREDGSFIYPFWADCKAMRERGLVIVGGDQRLGAFVFESVRRQWK